MSTTIDQRVVEMRFDNQNFERNCSNTLSSLAKLKQSLNLTGAAKGFENIDSAARKVNISSLGNAVETVGVKFNAMYSIADQALRNITTRVQHTAETMFKALTIDPIKTGFSEYETQINAVQTILANTSSKGTTLQDVNAALDTLNTYADKTIYNFTEMTRNIGTFTAAGVDLDKSVSAIQGIANLAAVSGSSSQQASTAMYQLSQALAAGRVSLMDWNSVVNAGMGGQVFQDALKRTAKNMGIVVDESKSFRESISGSDTWLSSDVLLKTLEQFTMAAEEGSAEWEKYKKSLMDDGYTEAQATEILKMANTATDAATKVKTFTQLWDTLKESVQSGWTQSWEIIIGDFGEAKETLTEISNVVGEMIGKTAEARNALLSGGLSSGWKQLLNAGIADEEGYKESIKSVAKEHGVALDEMIKKAEEEGKSFEDVLTESLKSGEITSDMLTESVTHLADSMRNMSEEERKSNGYTQEHLKSIEELEAGLKDGSISMDEFVKKMSRPSGRENIIQSLWNAFNGLMSVIKPVKEAFREIFPPMTGEQLYNLTEKLRKFSETLIIGEGTADKIKRTFKGVFAVISIGVKTFKAILDVGGKAISSLSGTFSKLFSKIDPAGEGILGFTAKLGDFLVSVNEGFDATELFNKGLSKIKKYLEPVNKFLENVATGIREFGTTIVDTFATISENADFRLEPLAALGEFIKGIFTGLGKLVSKVMPIFGSLAKSLGGVFGDLVDQIASSIQGTDYNKIFDILNGGIFASIGVFIAKFMKSAGDIMDNAGGFVENLQDIFGGVSDALNAFTGSLKADILKKIAVSIGILAASLVVLSMIDSDKLAGSLAAITVLFAELVGTLTIFTKFADAKSLSGVSKISAAMVSMSVALLILAAAMKIMSTMSWSEMGVGLVSIAAGMTILVAAVNLLPDTKVTKAAKAIRTMSVAMLILSASIKILSTMSWEEMGVGLVSMVVGLGAMIAAVNLLPKDTALRAAGMVGLATSMVILAAALKIMATMSWDEIARSLTTLAGSLLILSGAMALMKRALPGAAAMLIVAPALVVLGGALKLMATMSWEEISKGLVTLAGSLIIISAAMSLMKRALPGAAALVVVSASLTVLTPVLMALGSMSWSQIARGLTMLAGTFALIGVAGLLLKPLVPTLIGLSGAIALLGIGVAAIGVGVLAFATGLTALAAAVAASGGAIVVFVSSLIGLIPYLIEQIGVGFIKLCEVISGSGSAICDAFAVIITSLVDAIVVSAPAIVEGVLVIVDSLLTSLTEYTPKIVAGLFDFIIEVINALAEHIPDFIKAGVNLLMSVFEGVVSALATIDPTALINGILAIGMMSALVVALSAIGALIPAAMISVLSLSALVVELGIVFAAFGALAQIPGLEWLINEGGDLFQAIGSGIGKFLGGIVGGFATGASAALPQIGQDLADFMVNAQPFLDGVKTIDASALEGVKTLAGVLLTLTGANILEGLTSWLTGGSSLVDFGKQISEFAPYIKTYADTVSGIDAGAIEASANAAKVLSELATNLPNGGGVAGFFAGENDIGSFGAQLVPFGLGMKAYSQAITGFNAEAVIASANAAKAIADMTNCIPNSGGIVAWFTGENSIARFAGDLVTLGIGLSAYSAVITGFNAEAVIASSNAAKALAEMTSYIPNEGGLVAWFTGENSITRFAGDLVVLGQGLKGFSDSIIGIDSEALISASNAAKTLAEMTSYIPNEGGVAAWFSGENSISKFSTDLIVLGMGLAGFSASIAGINTEAMTSAAGAAKALADMTNYIPNEGGVVSWFTGENSISKFASQLPALGEGLAGFSNSITGINPDNVTAAANAAKALAEMTNTIPKEGGIKAWFTGETAISKFSSNLPALGEGLKGFSDSVAGISPENITAAADAAASLAKMADTTPKDTSKLTSFGDNLVTFGGKLSSYFEKTAGITADAITASSDAIKSITTSTSGLNAKTISAASDAIGEMVDAVKGMSDITAETTSGFSKAMKNLGETGIQAVLSEFENAGSKLTKAGQTIVDKFVSGAENRFDKVSKTGKSLIKKFTDGMTAQESTAKKACTSIVSSCATALSKKSSKFSSAGKSVVTGFASGITANTYIAEAKAAAMATAAYEAAKKALDVNSPSKVFRKLGYSIPEGFAMGITKLSGLAGESAVAMSDTTIDTVKSSIARIAEVINSDIDAQPTIRPVLDLSNVRSGASSIGSMLGFGSSIGVMSNVGAISSMMNANIQNGSNRDVVSAINDLKKTLGGVSGNTYNIEGITYDDGSNVSSAVAELVRAARKERRI